MTSWMRHSGQQVLRVALLVAIIAASGIGLGLAAGYPVSQLQFEQSDSVRLDQSRLAGEIDPAGAVLVQSDMPIGWEAGDPSLAGFSFLGGEFCGEEVALPTALSGREVSVFSNPTDQSFLISEAIRVDRWQSARTYVDDLSDAVSSCDAFFRTGLDGSQVQLSIRDDERDPPITDHVARTFVAEDGDSVQTWSVMAVGDVLIALLYSGPARPQEGLMRDLEERILIRIDPRDFAPGGVPVIETPDVADPDSDDPTGTTVLEGGAADESEAPIDETPIGEAPVEPPVDAEGGEPAG